MACVIPFPIPRPPVAEPDRFATFKATIAEIFASEAAEQGLTRPPKPLRHEEEILRRLRRIERILSQLGAPGRAPRDSGSASASEMPL